MKVVTIVMAVAAYAVFALIAKAMAELELLGQLAGYVPVFIGALLHTCLSRSWLCSKSSQA